MTCFIEKNKAGIKELSTLDSLATRDFLKENTYDSLDYTKYNLIQAPLGSKMQTVGSYFFWRKHPDILEIVFSGLGAISLKRILSLTEILFSYLPSHFEGRWTCEFPSIITMWEHRMQEEKNDLFSTSRGTLTWIFIFQTAMIIGSSLFLYLTNEYKDAVPPIPSTGFNDS